MGNIKSKSNDENSDRIKNKCEEDERVSKEWYKKNIYNILEVLDDNIPVVGRLMDLPIIDEIEQKIVDKIIDVVWDMGDINIDAQHDDVFLMCSA